ncbi:hypothetical protein UFOVP1367_20 [uncultured Caudovirales phage]|uniref:Uncharacterized protein n=1 Tax=uncultured Caudovirales phage TaxID=2100421 RepID=A0A6J5RVU1_9CAUD|nr:hypothetical protein KNT69_gp20 [uncultured Caudovirales phage]CAB4202510.1 hypothetical protein UFOVP1367_20 [uncultured Caudovirales phage]
MTILNEDLKIIKSANMSDAPEGGGGSVETVIVDGQSNNMFDDISAIDRVYGRVRLRKFFTAVRTQNTDKFFGSHVILSKLPGDTNLGINLFDTGDKFDARPAAAGRIENYRAQGGRYAGFLYGVQYQGTQVLTLFQSPSAQLPVTGDVMVLVRTATGTTQYIRIAAISSVVREFSDSQGVFTRRIVNVELSTPLTSDFTGVEMTRMDTITPPSVIFYTTVANAARYYSARPLKTAANIGDYSLTVDSIYSQVVPSSQSQTPLIDLSAGGHVSPIIDASSGTTSFITNNELSANAHLYLGRSCYPGSLVITTISGDIVDNAGTIKQGAVSIGTIDYAVGSVSFSATSPTFSGAKTVTYRPSAVPLLVADSASIVVTENSRSFVYAVNINPPPQPGALLISYLALGTWYELRDNAVGGISSVSDGVGSGSVNYVTGSVAITLSSLPDVGSEIILAWGKKVVTTNRSGELLAVEHTATLSVTDAIPETLTVNWNDGTAKAMTCNAGGVLSGDGTGTLATKGEIKFTTTTAVTAGTVFTIAYTSNAAKVANKAASPLITKTIGVFSLNIGRAIFNVGDADIIPGSFSVSWVLPWTTFSLAAATIPPASIRFFASSGSFPMAEFDNGTGTGFDSGNHAPVINYATGDVSFGYEGEYAVKFARFVNAGRSESAAVFTGFDTGSADMALPTAFTVSYKVMPGSPASGSATLTTTDTYTAPAVTLKLLSSNVEPLVADSVLFSFGSRAYVDRQGQLYHSIDPATGAGVYGGTINYTTATATLNSIVTGMANSGVLVAGLSSPDFSPVDKLVFRTASSPVKPGTFSIRAASLDGGGQITATANEDGQIATAYITGSINNNTGVVHVDFGQWVTAAGNEAEKWYHPSLVVGGLIFHPAPVVASSVVYNAVSFTYIPLSAVILGLDPVRLPIDGRIPVYRKGDVVVVLNDQTTVGTFTSSTTTDLGRIRLAKVSIKDLGGSVLDAAKYSVDLDTGIITWGSLVGISQPLKIVDRQEDMAVITDVQITGKISLSKPLTHAYNTLHTLVSNAVITGDMFARASVPFDQQTWTNVWSDSLIGSSTSAQYNANAYPVVVTNKGAAEERWVLIFTSSMLFNLIGERAGQIVTGASINNTLSPNNPATNDPYFTLDAGGFGGGWSAGNVLRFNTYSATSPLWVVQSIAQGDPTDPDYCFCIEFRGDVDAP